MISAKKWQGRRKLVELARKLMKIVGKEEYMDYNVFFGNIKTAAEFMTEKTSAADLKAVARAMSVVDPKAQPVVKRSCKANCKDIAELIRNYGVKEEQLNDYGYWAALDGSKIYVEYESDSDLRDTEKIPVKEDIYEYFLREVRPYVKDAWINLQPTKIGCEISFTKYFYKPAPLRSLEENEADILVLDHENDGFIRQLLGKEE